MKLLGKQSIFYTKKYTIILVVILIIYLIFIVYYLFFVKQYDFFSNTNKNLDMDIYVITLKRKERLDNIAEQQSKIPQEIQLFDAVKGDQLDIEQLIKDNLLSPSAGFLHEVSHKRVVGCYLSHYNIYKEIKKTSNKKYTLVLEDDFVIEHPNLFSEITTILDTLSQTNIDFDMMYLGNHNENRGDLIRDNIYHFDKNNYLWGTHAYIVNNKHIDKIIECTKKINCAIDWEIQIAAAEGRLNVITIYPYLVNIMPNNESTIHNMNIETFQ